MARIVSPSKDYAIEVREDGTCVIMHWDDTDHEWRLFDHVWSNPDLAVETVRGWMQWHNIFNRMWTNPSKTGKRAKAYSAEMRHLRAVR